MNFLVHSYTCCSDRRASPYFTFIRRWISMGFTSSLLKKRTTERILQAGPSSLHHYYAVVLHSCILLPHVGHSSNHEYHCCQLTRQSTWVSNFYCTFKVFIWLSLVFWCFLGGQSEFIAALHHIVFAYIFMGNWSIDNCMVINSTQTDLQPLCNVYLIWILLVLTRLSSVLFSNSVILAQYPISNWINCCFMHVTCTSHLSSSVSTVFPKLIYFNVWNFTWICNVWMLCTILSSWPFKMMSCMLLFELGLNATFSISYSEVHGSGWVIMGG